ncbi:hypothetical protein A3715_33890 [Oleiphilus sp. HI0009]|nr:hypothetical protein A3715_15590 [Oleiphilus sp. HI0009]KZX82580.1 hypothetical protein A3715_33890 [Oleiphilus sp. HI0009]
MTTQKLDKEALLNWLASEAEKASNDRDHAADTGHYGKAAIKDGEETGIQRVISKINLGDFNIRT